MCFPEDFQISAHQAVSLGDTWVRLIAGQISRRAQYLGSLRVTLWAAAGALFYSE